MLVLALDVTTLAALVSFDSERNEPTQSNQIRFQTGWTQA